MSLMVDKAPCMEIVVKYERLASGELKFHEEQAPTEGNIKEEKFFFRSPGWGDTKIMAKASSRLDESGRVFLDPYAFMDVRIKTLLCDWTLKDEKGNKLPIGASNVDSLHPSVLTYLSEKLDALESAPK